MSFNIDQEIVRGDEEDFNVNLEITSVTDNRNDTDTDTNNNMQQVSFSVVAMADISVRSL